MKPRVLYFLSCFFALLFLASARPDILARYRRDSDHYTLMYDSKTLHSSDLPTALGIADSNIINALDDLGIAIITSADPDFSTKASQIAGVKLVIKDEDVNCIHEQDTPDIRVDTGAVPPPETEADDPLVLLQWGLTAIHAQDAHRAGFKGTGVRVAILDTGYDLEHEDLIANIDFEASRSFVPSEPLQYSPPTEFAQSHGTLVAGIIAAADNGKGILGVAPEATLILIKVMTDAGNSQFSWIVNGFMHAVESGADVINMSFGERITKGSARARELGQVWEELTAYAHKKGVVLITATGNANINRNENTSFVDLPSDASHVITVTGTAPLGWAVNPGKRNYDNIASYADYGFPFIDFAAPGGDQIYPDSNDVDYQGIVLPAYVFDMMISTNYGDNYSFTQGCSFAAPHVAGVAALIIGRYKGNISPTRVEHLLKKSATDLGPIGKDAYSGYGRVNAYKAVTCK